MAKILARPGKNGIEYYLSDEDIPRLPMNGMMGYGYSGQHPGQYPKQHQSSPILVLGNGNGDLKKSLAEMVGLQREAESRFKDMGAEGLLKTILYREAVKELGIEPGPNRAYLQERIATEVGRGFVQDYLEKGDKYKLPVVEFMKENVNPGQFDLYSRTGLYVNASNGMVYHEMWAPVADLKPWMQQAKKQ